VQLGVGVYRRSVQTRRQGAQETGTLAPITPVRLIRARGVKPRFFMSLTAAESAEVPVSPNAP
jgi:hypothetical protein